MCHGLLIDCAIYDLRHCCRFWHLLPFNFRTRYEPGRHNSESGEIECRYNHNKGYVVFSAMGSFFIPMIVMLYVYSRICCVLTSRHNSMAKTEVELLYLQYFVLFWNIFFYRYHFSCFVQFPVRTGIGENQRRWHRLRQLDIRIREFAESATQITSTKHSK